MIMEFAMPRVIKIFSPVWGLSPYKPYPKGHYYRLCRRNTWTSRTTIWQH